MGSFVSMLAGNSDEITKVKYKVSVKTGDKKFSGTNSNVAIILHGAGQSTEKIWLNNSLKNDFERGNVDEFSVEALPLNKVDFIELIRGFSIFDDWFVDVVTVTEEKSGYAYVFPILRWLKPRSSIKIQHLDTILPQYDIFPEQRKEELEIKRKEYQLEVKLHGFPPQAKKIPDDEKFSMSYGFDIKTKTIMTKAAAWKAKRFIAGDMWKSFEHIFEAYTDEILPVPSGSKNWKDDKHFGQQRLTGNNAAIIKLCQVIPEKFPVTDEMVQSSLEGMTLQEAIQQKRLFIIDYELLTGIPIKQGYTVCDPIALFFVDAENNLMPIAIQLRQNPGDDNPIFLPSDPEYTWLSAKMWFNNSDALYHQSVTHLGLTHFLVEGICMATHRQLSPSHPIFKLLAPHFLYVIAINGFGLQKLAAPGMLFDRSTNSGRLGVFELMRRQFQKWRLNIEGSFPELMKSKGVESCDVLPKYYFRDDSMKLYEAIQDYVTEYVNIYYDADDKLTGDWELQQWVSKLMTPTDKGGIGLLGVPAGLNNTIDDKKQLIQIATSVIHIASVSHGAANFQQYEEYGYPPNYPLCLCGEPPKNKTAMTEKDVVRFLQDKELTLHIMTATQILSEKATNSLGYFEVTYIHDPKALSCLHKFRDRLREIGESIQEASRDPEYTWLHPRNIPNAISI